MIDDATLLRRYARECSEEAFAELVRRHLPLVYSAAARRLGRHAHRAGDVAQLVFIAAARDAARLSRHPVLTAWLHAATRNAAIDLIRVEKRRQAREQEAHMMQEIASSPASAADWEKLRPAIDGAIDQLSGPDREAVLLRFFQDRSFAEIGSLLGLGEDAARKRVDRALDRLHAALGRRGITSTAAALATLLAGQAASAAPPAGLAAAVTGGAVGSGTAVTSLVLMSATKISLGAAALLLVGGAVGLVSQQRTIAELRDTQDHLHREMARLTRANTELVAASETARAREATRVRPQPETAATSTPAAKGSVPTSATNATRPASRDTPEERARLHTRYDPFLERLGLTPAQMDRFVELKLAIADAQADFQAAVNQNGGPVTKELEAMRGKLTKPMWDEIRQLLGDANYKALVKYETKSYYQPVVIDLFRGAGIALADPQVDEVTQLLIKHDHPVRVRPSDMSTRIQIDWHAVVRDATDLLTPAQLTVLQRQADRQPPP